MDDTPLGASWDPVRNSTLMSYREKESRSYSRDKLSEGRRGIWSLEIS